MLEVSNQIHVLNTISDAIASENRFEQLCQVAAEQTCSLLDCKTVLIPILNTDATEYTYQAGFGANTKEIIGETLPIEFGVCGWVFKHHRAWWKGMLNELLPQERTMWESEADNLLLVPLIGKNRFLGGIACQDKDNGFDERDLELLNIIATPVALALENSLLVQGLEHQVSQRTFELSEEKNKAEQANLAKTEFLANISHELRTPMHSILAYSSMGIDKINDADKNKLLKYFTNIHSSGERLLLLLNDLLDLSKLEAGKIDLVVTNVSLQDLIGTAIDENESLASNKGISIKYEAVDFDTSVDLDSAKITQVMNNLISNALEYGAAGKEVSISITKQSLSLNNENNDRDSNALAVSVSDKGVGIPESELHDVFDKFIQSSVTTTKAGGTGLGLSICKEIINEHNGVIYAENNTGGGVTFTFVLPKASTLDIE